MPMLGFGYHRDGPGGVSFFHRPPPPAPPGELVLGGTAVKREPALPVVFIHGLGVGITPYLRFSRRLAKVRECFVIELPEISQNGTEKVLSPAAMASALAGILQAAGHQKACFIAHSYGTCVLSWVVRHRRDIVAKAVLLDPVGFLLAQPDVAYNFLYRPARNPFTMFVAHFVRWELFSAHVLMRNFYWYHNVLWAEDLPEDTTVVLASKDDIIDAHAVRCYLEERQRGHGDAAAGTSDRNRRESPCLKLLWLEGFFHAGILLSRSAQTQVMDLL
ncbi:unnamed protein product, partial [Polarella glacialis]